MAAIHVTDIEAAINWWRERSPSPDGVTACAEVRALATVYALMVYHHESSADEATMPGKARDAWLSWYSTTPDAPCIAICSTSQGDAVCKGCGRTFEEVRHWTVMTPAEKRGTWRRITMDGSSWRFNRYAERARESVAAAVSAAGRSAPDDPAPGVLPNGDSKLVGSAPGQPTTSDVTTRAISTGDSVTTGGGPIAAGRR